MARPGVDLEMMDEAFRSEQDTQVGEAKPDAQSPMQGLGALLEETDEKKVAETIARWVQQQAPARKRRRTMSKRNKLWMKGVRGVRARPVDENMTDWELYVPLGALEMPPLMDRTEELVERTISHLLADKPIPDAEPADESSTAIEAADFTSRMLLVEGAESGTNMGRVFRRASRKAALHGSGFVYQCVDPTGNGWKPMEIKAHPQAQSVEDAGIDPTTGLPVASDDALVMRFVKDDQSLTDDPGEAQRQWLPKIRDEVLTDDHVVLLPELCQGIEDCTGVVLIQFPTIADAKAKFPAFAKLPEEDIRALLGWSTDTMKFADPRDGAKRAKSTGEGAVPDDARFCTLTLIFRSHGAYPKGAYIVTAGGSKVLHTQPWVGMVERNDRVEEECLDINLVQVRQFDDDVDDDPMGVGMVAKIGAIDEVRGTITTAWMEYLDKFLHNVTYLPLGTIITPEQMQQARLTGNPLYFNPQGKPEIEKIEPFPPDAKEFFDRTTEAGNSATGLEETAQGVESPNSQSGVAKGIVVQQVAKNMSTLRDNLADAIERYWRVRAQLIRVFYTVPQQLKFEGEDASWRRKEWSRVDLGSTRQIRIAAGSFTQLEPEQKEALADKLLLSQVIDQQQYQQLISNNVRPKIGLKDNPFRLRVKRQIAKWKDGPPDGWMPVGIDPATGQPIPPQPDPMTGQPLPPQADPADPFDVRPVDDDPGAAMLRYMELSREQAGTAFGQHPPQWQQLLVMATEKARQGAGVATMAEQQAAAQAQADEQARQAKAQSDQKTTDGDKTRQAKAESQQVAGDQRLAELDTKGRQQMELQEAKAHADQMTAVPTV